MTKEEAKKKLVEYCNDEISRSGFWIFNKKKLSIAHTMLFEPWERIANLKLPERLSFPKDENNFFIDSNGIKTWTETEYAWIDIAATAIKTEEIIIKEDISRYDNYLLVCLKNGKILEQKLGNIDEYHGQIGHFIEQYKMRFKENKT